MLAARHDDDDDDIFLKSINLKGNVISSVEFELAYNGAVQHDCEFATKTPIPCCWYQIS